MPKNIFRDTEPHQICHKDTYYKFFGIKYSNHWKTKLKDDARDIKNKSDQISGEVYIAKKKEKKVETCKKWECLLYSQVKFRIITIMKYKEKR